VLHVTHAMGGGISKHVADLAALSPATDTFVLQPTAVRGEVCLRLPGHAQACELFFRLPAELPLLQAWVRELRIGLLHFHHLLDFDDCVWALGEVVPVRFFTFHDFYPACPRMHLFDAAGRYCGLPAPAACTGCLERSAYVPSRDILAWRARHLDRLRTMTRCLAPSPAIARLVGRAFPDLPVEVQPHPEPPLPLAEPAPAPRLLTTSPLRVAILGTLDQKKGRDLVLATARRLQRELGPGQQVEFHLIGQFHYAEAEASLRGTQQAWHRELTQTGPAAAVRWIDHGPYRTEEQLRDRLRAQQIQVVWISSLIPETYCYTLSAALQTGCWILCYDWGAQADRVRTLRRGFCAPADWDDRAWAEWIRGTLTQPPPEFDPAQCLPPPLANGFYPAHYLPAPLPARADDAASAPVVPEFFSEDSLHSLDSAHHRSRLPWPQRAVVGVLRIPLMRTLRGRAGHALRGWRRLR
jgi:hypothetical protein